MDTLPETDLQRVRPIWITPEQAARWQEFVRFAYEFGLLDQDEVVEVLRDYIMRDADGVEWTIGAETSQWYRREGEGTWVRGEPPPMLAAPDLNLSAFSRESRVLREATELQEGSSPDAEKRVESASAASSEAGSQLPYCHSCGASVRGKKFCTNCGTKLS